MDFSKFLRLKTRSNADNNTNNNENANANANAGGSGHDHGYGHSSHSGSPPPPPPTNFESLSPEVKLQIFERLGPKCILRSRLVSKQFFPKDVTIGLYLRTMEHTIEVTVRINLTSNTVHDENRDQRFVANIYDMEAYQSIPKLEVVHEVDRLDQLPLTFLQKIRVIMIGTGAGMDHEVSKITCHDRNKVKSICAFGIGSTMYELIVQLLAKSKEGLSRLCLMEMHRTDTVFDLGWLEGCHQLEELTLIHYPTANRTKLPPQIRDLQIKSPIALNDLGWISESLKNLQVLGLIVNEHIENLSLLDQVSEAISKIIRDLLGVDSDDPDCKPNTTHSDSTNNAGGDPTVGVFTPSLFKSLCNLPKIENMLLDFLVRDKDHLVQLESRLNAMKVLCDKTTGIQAEVRVNGNSEGDEEDVDEDFMEVDENEKEEEEEHTGPETVGLLVQIYRPLFRGF